MMHIKDKIYLDREGLQKEGPITIVAFGDSVTHGAVASGEMDYETVYWNRLKNKILGIRNYVPVNVINAGIGGITAIKSLDRMESQVLIHKPDLVIVCFGLNDAAIGKDGIATYKRALSEIFAKVKQAGAELIFMTPNMLNTRISPFLAEGLCKEVAEKMCTIQKDGIMDMYMDAAREVCKTHGVKLCDCYKKWRNLEKNGVDTTALLSNHINHPTREMSWLFAYSLADIIMEVEE